MTETQSLEPLEAFPMPDGAIELPATEHATTPHAMAVMALKDVLKSQPLPISCGPESAAEDPSRLLSLNRFALQLVTGGMLADQLAVEATQWSDAATAPQLVLAAQVDEENDVVAFQGVLTSTEVVEKARQVQTSGATLLFDVQEFRGGIARLLTLVQVLEPQAIPRLAIEGVSQRMQRQAIAVADWLSGQVDGALQQLFGAQWQPITQGAFFSGGQVTANTEALALVAIPLGLDQGELVCGQAADRCVERFVLQMLATGNHPSKPDGLLLRLAGAIGGDLLPDGLQITARQGSHEQRQVADGDTSMELVFQATGSLIDVIISYPGGTDLVLPPLQLPG